MSIKDKIYYQDEWATIYCGDCRKILPELPKANLILTDLPYGNNTQYDCYNDSQENLTNLVNNILPLMLDRADIVALTPGVGNMFKYPNPDWCLCWYIGQAGQGSTRWGFNCWQPILVWGKDPYLKNGLGRRADSIFDSETSDKTINHPCPKPTKFWRKVIIRFSPFNTDTVIDPFMGSGTTLVASKLLNRKSIGIELSPKYCEIAKKRLAQSVMVL